MRWAWPTTSRHMTLQLLHAYLADRQRPSLRRRPRPRPMRLLPDARPGPQRQRPRCRLAPTPPAPSRRPPQPPPPPPPPPPARGPRLRVVPHADISADGAAALPVIAPAPRPADARLKIVVLGALSAI